MRSTYRSQIADLSVVFDSPAETVFDYLVDPEMRPEWQASLRRIDDFMPAGRRPGGTGTTWTDVTVVPCLAPRMEVTDDEPYERWTEIGGWWFVDASLTLQVTARDDGRTRVDVAAFLTVPIALAPGISILRRLTPRALRDDLERAARILDSDEHGR